MGKTTRDRKPSRDTGLTQRPFSSENIPTKAGPECLKCGENIDTRLGRTLGVAHGAGRPVRQGWLCPKCQDPEERKFYHEIWHDLQSVPLKNEGEDQESFSVRMASWKRVRIEAEKVARKETNGFGGTDFIFPVRYVRDVVTNQGLEVPIFTDTELVQMLGGEAA